MKSLAQVTVGQDGDLDLHMGDSGFTEVGHLGICWALDALESVSIWLASLF